jgi:hypothetical protein
MPVKLPLHVVFAIPAVALACSAGLLTLLKSVLRSECPAPGGSNHRLVTIACLLATALCLVASAAYLVKSRSWTQAAAICSKWQPVYFVIMSVQRLVLTATVVYAVVTGSGRAGSCLLEPEYENAVHAISLMWNCAVLMASLSTMCCDTAADLSPRQRRCAYGLLALVLLLDEIGSVMWDNPLASNISISVTTNVSALLDSQLTSCIASQVVLALHFVYVACRSRRGRGWAYASLRFELDECGRSMAMLVAKISRKDTVATDSAVTPMLALDASAPTEQQHAGVARWKTLSRLRQRWLQFQQRQVSRCRVFVVPCVAMLDGGGSEAVFALARPALDLRWLQPLQRLADGHPRYYIGFGFFFLAMPSIACAKFLNGQAQGISTLVLNFCICVMMLGLLSSKRYGLDRIAAKHVALSFRFGIFVTWLATDVALSMRQVHTLDMHPTLVVAAVLRNIFFCLCILLDCSPHLPPSVQIYISVRARTVAMLRMREAVC